MSRCLYCYKELSEGMKDFHPACARKFLVSVWLLSCLTCAVNWVI